MKWQPLPTHRSQCQVAWAGTLGTLLGVLLIGVLLATPASALPVGQPVEFATEEQHEQYQKLVRELRCTVCQSETIYESNAPLAGDMRRRVYEMTADGASEEAIVDFMVQRYGNYVRYRPPLQADTVLLWASPFLLLVIGGLVWLQVVRQHQQVSNHGELSADERAALDRLRRGE